MEEMNGMDVNLIAEIVTTIVMVAVFVLSSGFLVMGSITMEIYDEKTKNEKKLIRYMGNVVLIIMSLVVCVSVWMRFDAMVCFAILVPIMTRSIEDALCATTYIGKVMKYLLMLLFLTGFVLILAAFRYDGILENNMVKNVILIAVSAVPFKAFVDMFNTDDTEESEN
ncbi:MAG: hypothetical protein E7301_10980 [Butyrivibrio sp.]|nr:hypothetical protein [Butyrivibrio sp.]